METKMKEMQEEAGKERQRVEAEYNRQMTNLDRHLREASNASKAERARLEGEIRRL